jgi:RTX calcium-binding nonapeptide repeat (4 copies)
MGARLSLAVSVIVVSAGLVAASQAFAAPGVSVSGETLIVTAAPRAKDNLQISRPSQSRMRVSDFPSGVYTGSAIHAGASCAQTGTKQVSCVATGIKRIEVSSRDRPDKVVNSTGIPSSLNGGSANDNLIGGSARDTLIGGRGPDLLRGKNGNDLLLARDRASDDLIDCDGGAGDRVELDRLPLDPNSAIKSCEKRRRG